MINTIVEINMRLVILCLLLSTMYTYGQTQVAVVELFTSQGCSSCPAADQLLNELVNSRSDQLQVIGLSFHVAYWNRLGWKDPYSSDQFTERQRWYAREMKLRSIYTPQMVVDGQTEFVGSSRSRLKEALSQTLTQPKQEIIIKDLIKEDKTLKFEIRCPEGQYGSINYAIVQSEASNFVSRGENQSKTLRHSNVVRVFTQTAYQRTKSMTMTVPDTKGKLSLIVYAHRKNSTQIGAVGMVQL